MKRLLVVWLMGCLPAAAADMVPFVIPAGVHPDSAIRMQQAPLTEQDRLHADGHFLTESGKRVRLWGVNFTFEANFPTHSDAREIARRLAAFGVNAVRCHHMDTASWPRGIWDQTGRALHPEALDRLDYFIDQLAGQGIYVNLNLQVGRKHSEALGLPDPATEYNKMASLFTPQLIEAQKEYARLLLTHRNPYRSHVAYAQDYAVAIVEITNENSLFMWDSEKSLRALPPFYADILRSQYSQWLKRKYGTTDRLRQVWDKQAQPLGPVNLLRASLPVEGWRLEQHEQAKAAVSSPAAEAAGLTIDIANADGIAWHLQYNHPGLTFEQGQFYTVILKARAPRPRPLNVSVQQAHEPWSNLGLYRDIQLTPDWQTFTLGFTAAAGDANGRLNLAFGMDGGTVQLGTVELRTGGQIGVAPGESLEEATVALFAESPVPARQIDQMCFLAETEKAYFDQMRAFLKNDLNCRAMVTGTIVFGPLGLFAQSGMDFIDSHAYWQHPQFPRQPWDSGDWLIEQKAMSGNPPGTLYELAAERLAGKPFTVTEYNHPAPLDSQAECVPMIASFAAAQDWDGVWIYTYSHSNNQFSRQHLNSYFDVDTNPAKWGFMPAGAVMYRQRALEPFAGKTAVPLVSSDGSLLGALAELHLRIDRDLSGPLRRLPAEKLDAFYHTFQPDGPVQTASGGSDDAAVLEWTAQDGSGLYWMHNSRCEVFCGHRSRLDKDRHRLQIDQPDSAAVVITALDGLPLSASGTILITACGRCENTGMQFSPDRRTVGRNWGTAPVRIEPVAGTLVLPLPAGQSATLKPLHPDGTVKDQIPIENGIVPLKAEYGTMWYLVQR
ncbi:MAG TPA: carbohydrate binding domain-containing protein [Anaerohalosphaeraceae bacterium]|nr:carbohydrate binding domain-containing protein [Anaerohalosphaeraceae bacterium]HPC64975.1 carbohydrate binding domain-containing protein [Anaerohalosphaeraceae bacterium]